MKKISLLSGNHVKCNSNTLLLTVQIYDMLHFLTKKYIYIGHVMQFSMMAVLDDIMVNGKDLPII